MRDQYDAIENKEYVQKVLLFEAMVTVYMDLFKFSKKEALQRIRETPLRKEDDFELEF